MGGLGLVPHGAFSGCDRGGRIYRFVRNPIYSGILLTLVGFGLTLSNAISLALLVIPNTLSFGYRIFVEERFLKAFFGESYDDYCRKSKRIIPFVF